MRILERDKRAFLSWRANAGAAVVLVLVLVLVEYLPRDLSAYLPSSCVRESD